MRADIQALRALAVMAVVVFHFWPARLAGGYVGVDVFFVISGFLITSHLVSSVARDGRVRLLHFWSRRVRRLLPAALLVVAASSVAAVVWVPRTFWQQYAVEGIASATYWENWRLAFEAVDYLGSENAPTAFQHYWSLSVEEQFYLVWPVLLVLGLAVARRLGVATARVFAWILAGVALVSFGVSVTLVHGGDPAGYFVTQSRAWEFAVGGLVALLPLSRSTDGRWRTPLAVVGWLALGATVVLYTASTPFPGAPALVPVLATGAIILARDTSALDRVLSWRPVQALGDNSYSIYLWHWPVVVIAPFALGYEPRWPLKVALLGAVVLAAVATKRYVEDPIRFSSAFVRSPRRTWSTALAATAVTVAVPVAMVVLVDRAVARSEVEASVAAADARACLGAASALEDPATCDDALLGDLLVPAPGTLKEDTGGAYACYDDSPENAAPGVLRKACTYGSTDPDATHVALTGNSHAASLLPGLEPLLEDAGWSLDVYMSRGCTWAVPETDDPCFNFRSEVNRRLTSGDYDLILVTERRSSTIASGDPNPRAEQLTEVWRAALAAGTTVVGIADNAWLTDEQSACLETADGYAAASECTVPEDSAFRMSDSILAAAAALEGAVPVVDMTDAYCWDGTCPLVIGHVGVYRDTHHITATYSESLGSYLMERIQAAAATTQRRDD
ncbi:acyltransferase family protein [Demequina maris]|uniref:acyltransferase family protein n=1 Tax=Demequina maris TaxID=1638982 RepID=UPI0007848822|nr:acyltransferase family protein [Demequina maris]